MASNNLASYATWNCHSLVLILILISIKNWIDIIFGQKPPQPSNPTHPPDHHRELNLAYIAQTIDISGYSLKQKFLISTRIV